MTRWIDTMFMRGGTSKGLMFEAASLPGGLTLPGDPAAALTVGSAGPVADSADLAAGPASASAGPSAASDLATGAADRPATDPATAAAHRAALRERDAILCAALGSPDPFGRQLDGMGGGVSSLSKAMIVAPSERPGIDLDYTFAQVAVGAAEVDYAGNCGNLSSAVAPFALAAGLIARADGPQRFALFNTNTGKRVDVRLTVRGGVAAETGELSIPGVAGAGSPVELVYPEPGGSRTSGLLPTGSVVDDLEVGPGFGISAVRASLVDATNPLVLVAAADIGVTAAEMPAELDANREAMALLERLRRVGAVRMGMCGDPESAPQAVPKAVVIAPPAPSRLLDGRELPAAEVDLLARVISMGQTHNAIPGTAAMCLAAAAQIGGGIAAEAVGARGAGSLRIGTPSGVVTAGAVVVRSRSADHPELNAPLALETSLARTARILMRGQVAVEL
ncbi:MAG: PrpF domain-containing protein [Leucobacter sp.]